MSRNNHLPLSLPSTILAGLVLMSAPLSAQAASYTYIDQKAPYQNGGLTFPAPMLTALNLPKIGTTFQVQVPNDYIATYCVGFMGCSQYVTVRASHVLAFGISNPNLPIPMLGGFVYSSAEVIIPAPFSNSQVGLVKMSFSIPNSPQLVGVRFYQQVLGVQWTIGYSTKHVLSRGGYGVIGK